MKQKVGKHIYNTKTATWLAEAEANVESTEDFGYFNEALYRTRRGDFFIAGYGGPMTVYASRHEDGSIGWGEAITPLSKEAAKAWCDKHHVDLEEEGIAYLFQ